MSFSFVSPAAAGSSYPQAFSPSAVGSNASTGASDGTAASNNTAQDSVNLSLDALKLLAVSESLTEFENAWQSLQKDNSASVGIYSKLGPVSSFVTGADNVSINDTEFFGSHVVYEAIRGSSDVDEVLNAAIYNDDTDPNTIFQASVSAGNGNDIVNVASNAQVGVWAGNGNDIVNVTTTGPNGSALIGVGSGNDVINLTGSGQVVAGTGNDVINLTNTGSPTLTGAVNRNGGNAIINGNGPGTIGWAVRGNTIINNVDQAEIVGSSGAVSTINLDNEAYSQVKIIAGVKLAGPTGGSSTINLSDPAAGVSNDTAPYSEAALEDAFDNSGHRRGVVAADADGNFSGDYTSYLDVLPTEGQAGYGLAHTRLDFVGVDASDVSSTLDGSTLTLTVGSTGQTVTVNNYQAGRISFTFGGATDSGDMTASRLPPGLTQA